MITRTEFGAGALATLRGRLNTPALVISDRNLEALGMVDQLEKCAEVPLLHFCELEAEPTTELIDQAASPTPLGTRWAASRRCTTDARWPRRSSLPSNIAGAFSASEPVAHAFGLNAPDAITAHLGAPMRAVGFDPVLDLKSANA